MPLCSLHLISLNPQTTIPQFITSLKSSNIQPLTISRVIRWIIIPEKINTAQLLEPIRPYDLLIILPTTQSLPGPLEAQTSATFSLDIGIPSRLLKDYTSKNASLLHPDQASIPALTGSLDEPIIISSAQSLALSRDLQSWISTFSQTHPGKNAMSMLNLLSFHPDKKESYLAYGKAFAESIGSRRGGDAKLVGHVVYPSKSEAKADGEGEGKWDEFALAHYPSIMHFADMLASKDYQDVNQKFRVPALRDTCILCTSEIEVEELMRKEGGAGKAKL